MVTRPAVSLFTERKSGKFYAVVLRCGLQHGGRICDDAETGGCSAPATAEALLSSDAPGGIRTHDLRLRRRHRPATINAGRCRFRHLRESGVGQRQPVTAALLPLVLPRVC